MNAVAEMPAPLIFTDSAATKVSQLIAEEGNPDLKKIQEDQPQEQQDINVEPEQKQAALQDIFAEYNARC